MLPSGTFTESDSSTQDTGTLGPPRPLTSAAEAGPRASHPEATVAGGLGQQAIKKHADCPAGTWNPPPDHALPPGGAALAPAVFRPDSEERLSPLIGKEEEHSNTAGASLLPVSVGPPGSRDSPLRPAPEPPSRCRSRPPPALCRRRRHYH